MADTSLLRADSERTILGLYQAMAADLLVTEKRVGGQKRLTSINTGTSLPFLYYMKSICIVYSANVTSHKNIHF